MTSYLWRTSDEENQWVNHASLTDRAPQAFRDRAHEKERRTEAREARPNSYSEAAHFTLPNSHFEVTYSRLYYHLVPGNPAGVIPDKLLPPTWSDYRTGNDSALDWVINRASVN